MWPFSILFRSRKSSAASAVPVEAADIARTVDCLLARQYADAAAKDRDAWQWGATGSVVRRAARACECILLPLPATGEADSYLQRVLPLLAELADRYRSDNEDADGYGLGTVREIEEGLLALTRQAGTNGRQTR